MDDEDGTHVRGRHNYGASLSTSASNSTSCSSDLTHQRLKGISQIKENANEPLLSQHRSHRTKRSRTLLKKPSLVVWAIVRGLISRMETALVGFSQVICSWGPGTPPEARRRGHVAPSKAVHMRLHPFETSDNILEAFRSEVDKQLKQHKIAVRWHPCSPVPPRTLSLVIHYVAERLNVARLLHEVQQLAKKDEDNSEQLMVILVLKHNPGLVRPPRNSREMSDGRSYADLESHVLGGKCLDWYFWSTSSQDPRLRQFNWCTLEEVCKQAAGRAQSQQGSPPETARATPSGEVSDAQQATPQVLVPAAHGGMAAAYNSAPHGSLDCHHAKSKAGVLVDPKPAVVRQMGMLYSEPP